MCKFHDKPWSWPLARTVKGLLLVLAVATVIATDVRAPVLAAQALSSDQGTQNVQSEKEGVIKPGSDPALTEELMSVRALMRVEMAQALARAKRESARLTSRSSAASGKAVRVELADATLSVLAIYGVGSQLVAEVQAGARTLTYINGKAWPVGVASGETVFRLVSMQSGCLTLERQGEQRRACIKPQVGGAQ